MKKYSRKNGYYKFYNKEGKKCRIKIDGSIKNKELIFILRYPNSILPRYYVPNRKFTSKLDLIHHIVSNLETDGLVVETHPVVIKIRKDKNE